MEFTLDSDNIQVILKDKSNKKIKNPDNKNNILNSRNSSLQSPDSSHKNMREDFYDIDSLTPIVFEILIKLEDYYLINNIKIVGEVEELTINKIKFQNVNSGNWELVSYFNPDNYKEISMRDKNSLSTFSVGLTQHIKIEISIKNADYEDVISNRTLDIPENNIDMTEFKSLSKSNRHHNQSMQEIGSNNRKKKIFNLNNAVGNNQQQNNIHLKHLNLKLIKNLLQKIVVFSQYIYMIPNSTYLLTLLNLKNYFMNKMNLNECENYHYLCSLFLTASSMIQARLFIQAWELFNKLQLFIINNITINSLPFLKILLEHSQLANHMLLSNSSDVVDDLKGSLPIFLAKLEIIKSVCMYEHGHTLAYLDSLKNCINIYFYSDFSGIKLNISWVKNNEIGSDKYFIQNYLSQYGKNLSDILILLLKDQSEIITVSSLKIIEFILDYNPSIVAPYYSKIIKILLKYLYNNSITSHKINSKVEGTLSYKMFEEKNVFFMEEIYQMYHNKKSKKKASSSNTSLSKVQSTTSVSSLHTKKIPAQKQQPTPQVHGESNISPILLKQLNYTLDTMINNLDNLPTCQIKVIAEKINFIILNILKNSETDSILNMNIIKLARKLYENLNSSILNLFVRSKKNFNFFGNSFNRKNNNLDTSHCLNFPPEEQIFLLFSFCLNTNSILQFKEFYNLTQIQLTNVNKHSKHSNNKPKFAIPSINLFENSDLSSLTILILDKISEECILLDKKQDEHTTDYTFRLLEWFNDSIEIIQFYFLKKENEEFYIYYSYILIYLLNYLFFSKSDVKSEVNKIFLSKINLKILKVLDKFIYNLANLEELCLFNKKYLILFDILINLMKNVKKNFDSAIKINFSLIFEKQYENFLNFIIKNGIFSENIYFLIKTIPLLDIPSAESKDNIIEVKNNNLVFILQKIFFNVLKNFSNYYNEDMFELFSLLLNKLKEHLNQELVDSILSAIISKYNYKGNNFKNCCNIFFSVILEADYYFEYFKKNILKSIENYFDYVEKMKNKVSFKEVYLEFMEKLELYKKYLEFIKNEKNVEILFKGTLEHQLELIMKKFEELLFSDVDTVDVFLSLARVNDDSVLAKINEIILEDFEFMEILMKFVSFNIAPQPSSEYSEENSVISKLIETNFTIFSNHSNFTSQFYFTANKICKNHQLLIENYHGMTKINNNLNLIIFYFSKIYTRSDINPASIVDLNLFKIKFFKSLFDSINFKELKDPPLKNELLEVMNFLETTIIKCNEINQHIYLTEYYALLSPIIYFFLDSNDDFQIIFGIEIILKFFNITFEEGVGYKQNKESANINLNLPREIWEKIINISRSNNYKISIFAIYILQVIAPKDEIVKSFKNFEIENKNDNLFSQTQNLRFIVPIKVEESKLMKFMNEQEIENLHIFIRDKIIFEFKIRNTLEKNIEANVDNNIHSNNNEEMGINKVDEINDNDLNEINEVNDYIDLIKIPNLDDDEDTVNEYSKNKNEKVEKNRQKKDKISQSDENMSLEELGVFEAEDEIFDNFDEDNIPVIKNIYKRKKGSAEKLKTNQNGRNLLMSDHVKKDNMKDDEKEDRYTEYNKVNVVNKNKKKQKYLGIKKNSEEICEDDLLIDMQIKKKNIRPQNGLRPATPPLKQSISSNTNQHTSSINSNQSIYKNPNKLDIPLDVSRKKRNSNKSDKKYEIKSMEELFLDEEEKNTINNIIPNSMLPPVQDTLDQEDLNVLKNQGNVSNLDQEINMSYEEEILNSFENLNEEDFKNLGSSTSRYKVESNNDKYKIKIPGVDYPMLNQINEYLRKSQSQNNIPTFSNMENMESIKIEDYEGNEGDEEDCLENDYNNLDIDEEDDIIFNRNIRYEDQKSESSENADRLINTNGDEYYQLENDQKSVDEFQNFANSHSERLEILRQNKLKRPPTRYGNREDQVKWHPNNLNSDNQKMKNKINISNILKNKDKFKPLSSLNDKNSSSLMRPTNNTFNNIVSMTDRIHSPNKSNIDYSHSTNQQILPHNISANDISLANIQNNKFINIKKNIHNLHNLHKNNQTATFRNMNEGNNMKVSSEFRKLLKSKLTKNSEKIFANLRKLSNNTCNKTIDFSKSNINSNNSIVKNPSSCKVTTENMNSAEIIYISENQYDEKDEEFEYNYPKQRTMKKNNYVINTNLTESKYLVQNTNKTPNFNYNVSASKEK